MAEDIESKIRRLRELGKTATEPETPPTAKPKPEPGARLPRRGIGSLREKERKRRIIIGASIIIALVLIASFGVYTWYSNKKASELENARGEKLKLLDQTFKPLLDKGYGRETYSQLRTEILQAKSKEELNRIDINAAYSQVLQQYEADLQRQKQLEFETELNRTKEKKIQEINTLFQPLLEQSVSTPVRGKILDARNSLINQVENANSIEDVNGTNPIPIVVSLWQEVYKDRINSMPGSYVILEYNGTPMMLTKTEAKGYITSVMDLNELLKYRVRKVEFVRLALLVPKERLVGGFLKNGDKVRIYTEEGTIADMGYIEDILIPATAGVINLNENMQSVSGNVSNSSQYYYSVDLVQLLRALAANKTNNPDELMATLKDYGIKLTSLEKETQLMNIPYGVPYLVIVKVPDIYVPKILYATQRQYDSLTIVEVLG
ncbi:DUF515 domain-containing protein [Thermococcus waiotapuensis]|uniref:DUF515 domain-containing protein n=1 Tax=Thermococcus waiotapuensis TaxID=90909 RepID=A0AAE4SYJ3_9EURY|nr:DUF515 domain-containing protein [Thermococcus waiotapuensis]MDV3103794.1 DUF515 domain-containing protein [Thermococcus waiotapuensis]